VVQHNQSFLRNRLLRALAPEDFALCRATSSICGIGHGGGFARDEEGNEPSDLPDLRRPVIEMAHDLMRTERLNAVPDWHQCSYEVRDDAGTVALTLPFSEAAE